MRVKGRQKQDQESKGRAKKGGWRLQKGGQNFKKSYRKKEVGKKDTVLRGGG